LHLLCCEKKDSFDPSIFYCGEKKDGFDPSILYIELRRELATHDGLGTGLKLLISVLPLRLALSQITRWLGPVSTLR
jgi:hypothetical protein